MENGHRDMAAAYFANSNPRQEESPRESTAPDPAQRTTLESAEASARGLPAVSSSGTVVPCPLQQTLALEVSVLAANGAPAADIALELRKSDTQALTTKADDDGHARFNGLEPGSYTLSLVDVDADAWTITTDEALPSERRNSDGAPCAWQTPAPPGDAERHVVAQGECVSTIGHGHGLLPDTLWSAPSNEALAALRADKNILNPGDVLMIPAPRRADVTVAAGRHYHARLEMAPTLARLRFMDAAGQPRVAVPYLLRTVTPSAEVERMGETSGDGFVIEEIAADASAVTLTLGKPPEQLLYDLLVAELDPIDTVSGVQRRLQNLGYPCGNDALGTLGPYTQRALLDFQRAHQLPETLTPDAATREKLKEEHAS